MTFDGYKALISFIYNSLIAFNDEINLFIYFTDRYQYKI